MGSNASTNNHRGSFVYGDASIGPIVNVQDDNSFVVRAQRVWFGKAGDQVATLDRYIETSTGAYLTDGGTWTNASSRDLKENFRNEDGEAVLAKIAELPIQSWNYKVEDPAVRHLGPTSQDFQGAFGLGDSDAAIGTVDIDGVNLLAIQALEKRTADLRAEVAGLREQNAALLERLTKLEAMVRSPVRAESN